MLVVKSQEYPLSPIFIGTCSWKYESWKGIIYSENAHKNYLREYAEQYNTVEIDQWFWSLFPPDKIALPKIQTVREYVESVPEDFLFTVKVPNSITLTHFYRKKKSDPLTANPHFLSVELFRQFLDALEPMHSRLGPLIFQFEYLNKQKMSGKQEFLDRLFEFFAACPNNFSYSIETRNPNYLDKNYVETLQQNNLAQVFLHGYYMPSIFEIFDKVGHLIKDLTIVRLHGPDRQGIEKQTGKNWRQIVAPKDDELFSLAQIIKKLNEREVTVYVNVNNHYEGSAPLTISRLYEQLQM